MNNELLASLKREMKARDEIKRREAYELELREQIAAWKLKADEATRLCRPDLLYNTSPSFQIPLSFSIHLRMVPGLYLSDAACITKVLFF